jgi:hypothetical protein
METTTIPADEVREGQMLIITASDGTPFTGIVREIYSLHENERTINMHTLGEMTFATTDLVTVVTEL